MKNNCYSDFFYYFNDMINHIGCQSNYKSKDKHRKRSKYIGVYQKEENVDNC